jgi:deoxycytidylate deaminase
MTLYIVRLNQSNRSCVDSSPCRDCYEKLCKLKLKRIVYSTMDGFESVKLKDYNPTSISQGDNFYNRLLEND